MSEFIVLGIIPGTQVQITFILWVILTIALGMASIVWVLHRTHIARNLLITISLFALCKTRPMQS